MTDKYSREEGFLRLLAKSYLTHNADTLIKIIPDDFGYDSMWVFDSIKSKARYKEYITGKLESMKNGMYNVVLKVMERNDPVMEIRLQVPDKGLAEEICRKWPEKNEKIYNSLIENLF